MRGTKGLIEDLEKESQNASRDVILEHARAGRYHDFRTPLDFPKRQLADDLHSAGYLHLARKVVTGEYDDEFDGSFGEDSDIIDELTNKKGNIL